MYKVFIAINKKMDISDAMKDKSQKLYRTNIHPD